MGLKLRKILKDDWIGVRQNFDKIKTHLLGPAAAVSHAGLTLTDLTDGRVIYAGAGGTLSDDGSLLWNNSTKILSATGRLKINDAAVNTTATYHGIYNYHAKTAGATDYNDDFNGIYNYTVYNQSGGVLGVCRSLRNEFQHIDGDIGTVGNPSHLTVGVNVANLDSGKIYGPVAGYDVIIDQESGHEITGNVYGCYLDLQLDGTVGGTSYVIYMPDRPNIDYGLYQAGKAPSYFGGTVTVSKTNTVAGGTSFLRVTGLQTDGTAMTGTLRGAYIDVSNGSTAATGTIRGMELKARTEAPGDTGNDVTVLEGLSISADSKGHSVTIMRAAEFILDGSAGGTITEAVGLRIANNLQADKATTSYGLQIYRDSFDYTADIQLSSGGLIGGTDGALQINTNDQVTINKTSATYPFLINSTDGSNQIKIYHDNIDMYIKTTDGSIVLLTDEGTNTSTNLTIKGKGTGFGSFYIYDQDDAEYTRFYTFSGRGYLDVVGSSPLSLELQSDATGDVSVFSNSAEGETKEVRICGFGSGFGGIEHLAISIEQYAANTAEFFGLDAYMFQGNLITLNDTHSDANEARKTSHDFKGEQSGGEQTTLARIEAGHDGSADDEKGYLDVFTNAGSDGDSPTKALRIDSNLGIAFAGALAGAWDMGSQALTNVNIDSGVITGITDLAIADGGTGQSTAQLAINALSAVSGATNEHVLTKDTGTGNAIWKTSTAGTTFISLTDVDPANYTGEAGNAVVVNAGEDGLEFGAAPGGGGSTLLSGCSVYLSGAQSVATSGWRKVNLDTEVFDIDGEYDNSSNYRFTPTRAGYYQVSLQVAIHLFDGPYMCGAIWKNGAAAATSGIGKNAGLGITHCISTKLIYLDGDTDYIEFYIYHGDSVNRDIYANADYTFATIAFIGV